MVGGSVRATKRDITRVGKGRFLFRMRVFLWRQSFLSSHGPTVGPFSTRPQITQAKIAN